MKRIAFAIVVLLTARVAAQQAALDPAKFLTQPLVSEIYTADPSAHVFNGRI